MIAENLYSYVKKWHGHPAYVREYEGEDFLFLLLDRSKIALSENGMGVPKSRPRWPRWMVYTASPALVAGEWEAYRSRRKAVEGIEHFFQNRGIKFQEIHGPSRKEKQQCPIHE